MHQMNQHPLSKYIAWVLAVLLAMPFAVLCSGVDAQIRGEITAAVVLPIVLGRGLEGELLSQKATAAVALALEESREFRIISESNLQRELRELSLEPPLSQAEQIRVGKQLQADKVISGTLHELTINRHTGECRVRLELRSLDIDSEAVLNGAINTITTKRIPGWEGPEVRVVNEGLREAAEATVAAMLRTRIPRGNVDLVDDLGVINLNLGARDGLYRGMQMLVKRGYWEPDIEKVVMRDIGTIEIDDAQARLSTAHSISGQTPRTGDKVYALYTLPEIVRVQEHKRHVTSSLRKFWALGMLAGLWAIGSGGGSTSAPGADVHLYQTGAGGQPIVRVNVHRGWNPDADSTHDWLFFRGESPGFPAEVDDRNYLVGAVKGGHVDYWEDTPERRVGLTFEDEFTFLDREGEEEDGDVDIDYNHLELIAGRTYYYKVRRIVDPWRPIIPIAEQVDEELEDVSFSVDPADALSEASSPAGPVTYFQPPTLSRPTNGSTTVNPQDVTFEWQPSTGAGEYRVFVYDNPNFNDPPVYQHTVIWTGQSAMQYRVTDFTFSGDRMYYWAVGARVSGEPAPKVWVAGQDKTGWVLSNIWIFQTVSMPPPVPSAAGQADGPRRPGVRTGWWGERPIRQMPRQ